MTETQSNIFTLAHRRWLAAFCAVWLACGASGCVNSLMMVSRIILGDPVQTSGFETQTHVNLKKSGKLSVVHCSAPASMAVEYSSLSSDLQRAMVSRMKRRGIEVERADLSHQTLNSVGGRFDASYLARQLTDVTYFFHIEIDQFSHLENSSPNLYRGHAHGHVIGYEARGSGDDRHASEVFHQTFDVSYPGNYPIAIEQTSKAVFLRQFQDHLADRLGASFYDVSQSEIFGQ